MLSRASQLIAVIALAGIPDNLRQLGAWIAEVNWSYWMNSGQLLPWGIRLLLAIALVGVASNPEAVIRAKDKLLPRWQDTGERITIGFSWGWWRTGLVERWRRFRNHPN